MVWRVWLTEILETFQRVFWFGKSRIKENGGKANDVNLISMARSSDFCFKTTYVCFVLMIDCTLLSVFCSWFANLWKSCFPWTPLPLGNSCLWTPPPPRNFQWSSVEGGGVWIFSGTTHYYREHAYWEMPHSFTKSYPLRSQEWPTSIFSWQHQALVVQTMDNAIHWISIRETNCAIQWIVIYPVDCAIHLLGNWRLQIIKRKCYESYSVDYQRENALILNQILFLKEMHGDKTEEIVCGS